MAFCGAFPMVVSAAVIKLEVGLGVLQNITEPYLPNYLAAMYQFLVSGIAIVAVGMIIFGGAQWALAAGNKEKVSEGKDRITNALIGLVIALLSWTIINMISPTFTIYGDIDVPELSFMADGDPSNCTSGMQTCLAGKYENLFDKDYVDTNYLVRITVDDGVDDHAKTLAVHKDAQLAFENAFATIAAYNYGHPSSQYDIEFGHTGTWAWRQNVNNPSCYSNHSFGFAIDVNWSNNPNCKKTMSCYTTEKFSSDMCANYNATTGTDACDYPDWLINAFKNEGFMWGGDWSSVKDYMHYEWTGHGCSY